MQYQMSLLKGQPIMGNREFIAPVSFDINAAQTYKNRKNAVDRASELNDQCRKYVFNVEPTQNVVRARPTLQCARTGCENYFRKNSPTHEYCSRRCREKAARKRAQQKTYSGLSLAEVNKLALDAGENYGKYVAKHQI